MRRRPQLVVSLLCALALTAACGTRLTPSQEALAIGASGSAGGRTGTASGDVVGDAGVEGLATGIGGTGASAGPGAGGASSGTGGAAAGAKLPAAPAGGNGGATDVGVTADTITIANIASLSGVAPGLFESAQQATAAFVAYVNSQGGVYGRKLKMIPYDDKNDSSENRSSALDACKKAFALVGSISAFDDGGAEATDQCNQPSVAVAANTQQSGSVPEIFPVLPPNTSFYAVGPGNYIKSKYPEAIKKAAVLYLSPAVTTNSARRLMAAYSSIGFEFVYQAPVQVTEPNYAPYVLQMRQQGVQYVTMFADYNSVARLEQAMRQQGWQPQVRDWSQVMYDPGFVKLTQPQSEGDLVLLTNAMYEEAGSNPELALYLQWLEKTTPGAKRDFFGIMAWASGRLFLDAIKAVGPKLTRPALLAALANIHSFDANGIMGKTDVGAKLPSPCFLYAQITGGKFVRTDPASGFACNFGGLFKLP